MIVTQTVDESLTNNSITILENNVNSQLEANPGEYSLEIWPGTGEPLAIFYVNDWNITNTTFYDFTGDPGESGLEKIPVDTDGNSVDQVGIPAQGEDNEDPFSQFTNHALVKYGGKYYDPSYGNSTVNSLSEWEDASIAGFGTTVCYPIDIPCSPASVGSKLWVEKLNTEEMLEMVEEIISY